jgi:hypothetical protein
LPYGEVPPATMWIQTGGPRTNDGVNTGGEKEGRATRWVADRQAALPGSGKAQAQPSGASLVPGVGECPHEVTGGCRGRRLTLEGRAG